MSFKFSSPILMTAAAAMMAAGLSVASATSAEAQACEPAFVSQSTAHRSVRASVQRFERGQWRQAAHFANEALSRRNAAPTMAAARTNLCGALANLGDAGAAEACDAAVEANEGGWEALNNRGAAHALAGNMAAASADFAAAAAIEGAGPQAAANAAACR
ncbi:hypothetical protein AB6B38_02320 [Glycocaulis abyssi]|uniref:Tetratricopeptide repeat protein n=1 Tax=Glycocaulis abyssi TaxID=1433403 RepID=A0ABV9NBL1_9PROT